VNLRIVSKTVKTLNLRQTISIWRRQTTNTKVAFKSENKKSEIQEINEFYYKITEGENHYL